MNARVVGLWLTVLTGLLSVGLLLISGGFIVDAGLAGAVALAGAYSYNLLVPSAFVRLFALGRVASNYFERLMLHDALLAETHDRRLALFDRLETDPLKTLGMAGWKLDEWLGRLDQHSELLLLKTAPARQAVWVALVYAGVLAGMDLFGWALAWLSGLAALAVWARRGSFSRRAIEAHSSARIDAASRVLGSARLRLIYRLSLNPRWGSESAVEENRLTRLQLGIRLGLGAVNVTLFAGLVTQGLDPVFLAALSFALLGLHEIVEKGLLALTFAPLESEPPVSRPEVCTVLKPARRLWLRGPSGAGKSLALANLTGIESGEQAAECAWLQQFPAFIDASVRDNLNWYANVDDAILLGLLDQLGLSKRLPDLDAPLQASRLSGGEQRRLGLIRVAVSGRPLWLLDEPLVGLDAQTAETVLDFLESRDEQIVIASHDERVKRLTDLEVQWL